MRIKLLTVAFFAVTCQAAFAQTTAGTYAGGGVETTFSLATGWRFTMSTDATVTSLGLLDLGNPGFASDHMVGLFAVSQPTVALATVSLSSGTSGYALDGSRWADLSSTVTLTSGVEYYLLADNFSVDMYAYGTGVSYAADVNWLGYTDGSSNSIFSNPTHYTGLPGDLGPNFRYEAVPEPATLIALGLGASALLRRKRNHR